MSNVSDILDGIFKEVNLEDAQLTYIQPKLNEDGSCPIIKEAGEKFDLAQFAKSAESVQLLKDLVIRLQRVCESVQKHSNVGWFGIYLNMNNVLTKFAYIGEMSRADFALTEDNLEKSTNVKVGLQQKTIYIPDVAKHNGAYYRCDEKVQSELCVPLLDKDGNTVGIFDAEDSKKHFFDKYLHYFAHDIKTVIEFILSHHNFVK